jgi:hypothetical protein
MIRRYLLYGKVFAEKRQLDQIFRTRYIHKEKSIMIAAAKMTSAPNMKLVREYDSKKR